MNMQAMMQQAQKVQQEMKNAKKKVEERKFNGKSSLVDIEVNGKKEVTNVTISNQFNLANEDIEMIQDMILIAANEALSAANKEMEAEMSKINPGLNGLF